MLRILITALALTSALWGQSKAVREVDSEKGIQVSCRVEKLDGSVVFDWDGTTPRVLASNVKLLTTAAALMELPPDFRWQTRVYLDQNKLYVLGGGDPSIRKLGKDDVKELFLDGLASALQEAGVKQLDEVVLDDRYFDSEHRPPLWPDDQWQRDYSAPVGGLMVEGGCLELHGENGQIKIVPSIGNSVSFSRSFANDASQFSAYWLRADERLKVSGAPKKARQLRFAVGNPVRVFGLWLQAGLRQRGIDCSSVETVASDDPPPLGELLWQHSSAWTLQDAIVVANKQSDNFVSECLLKTLGAERKGDGSRAAGLVAVREILGGLPLDLKGLNQTDGSGFARASDNSANTASPAMICALLRAMAEKPQGKSYFESLPIAEHSRRIKKFFTEPIFKPQRVHAKTGWITGASSLSGYLQTPDQQTLVFSIVVNYIKDNTARTNNFRFRSLQAQIIADVLSS
jgi:serine-type D-Ala-D-Ala carboxypeptidase/endopeptidase (penicillin-binding protein 4)